MPHNLIQLLKVFATGVCEIHGRNSRACDAAKELATLGISMVTGAALGGSAGGGKGALVGLLAGGLVGLGLNQLETPRDNLLRP